MSEAANRAATWFQKPAVLCGLAALVAAIMFIPAMSGGWVYDDHPLIPNNPFVHSFQHWPRWFMTEFWDVNEEIVRFGSRVVYWRPMITTSYALDWQLGGGQPLMFHITNTLAQAAVGALAFLVLRRWIGRPVPAFLAAVLFVVHPTKAESVAWIAGRTDVFCMIAVFVATQGIARRLAKRPGGLALEVLGTLAAYMCKEQAIVLPIFVVVEAWVAAGRPNIDWRVSKKLVVTALPQAILAIAYFVVRGLVLPIQASNVEGSIPVSDHVQAFFETIGRFVSLTFLPHDLSIQQGLVRVGEGRIVHSTPYIVIGVVALVVLVALAILARRRWPVVTIGIGFYLVTLAPTSNIVYTDMLTLVSERFLYLPVLGLALVAGALVTQVPARWGYLIAIAAILATGIQSLRRAADYQDEGRFWARELELHPESPVAQQYMIKEALRLKQNQRALRLTLKLTTSNVGFQDAGVAVQLAEILALIVPDHDVAGLRAIDTFLSNLLDPNVSTARIELRGVTFSIPTQSRSFLHKIRNYRLEVVNARVDIHSRLGDDAGALAIAERELSACKRCVSSVLMAVLARARAGDYEGSLAVLDDAGRYSPEELFGAIRKMVGEAREAHQRGISAPTEPARLQARASELAALELWGRAYDVLAPYKAEILRAPKAVIGFAELALRAGEAAVAREVLSTVESDQEVKAHLDAWTQKMGWAD